MNANLSGASITGIAHGMGSEVAKNNIKGKLSLSTMGKSNVLYLTLTMAPFEIMVTGEKIVEYRYPSPWIKSRLVNRSYDRVRFVNGYGKDRPWFEAEYMGFDQARKYERKSYSNGILIEVDPGTYRIFLGRVLAVGNYELHPAPTKSH